MGKPFSTGEIGIYLSWDFFQGRCGVDANALLNLSAQERDIRLLSFLVIFGLMALWEWKARRRDPKFPKKLRWPNNLLVALLNALLVRVVFPASTLGAAYMALNNQFGLFNWVDVPFSFAAALTIINLDWVIYYQHRALHALPWLWKLHRVHHSDLDVDVTTGTRFHPLEVALSVSVKSLAVMLLGAPVAAVLLYELFFNASSLFNHANIRTPLFLDKILRLVIVTPDMHRVHHSSIRREYGSNFGFIFSWWDRLFGSYRAQPEKGHEQMTIGLEIFNDPKYLKGDQILLQPFMDKRGHAALSNFNRPD